MKKLSDTQEEVIRWWKSNGRAFPWRSRHDTYSTLVAEVLLHRTRAENVAMVYPAFMKSFETVDALARAKKESVLNIVRPLGLVWRAEMLFDAANVIKSKFDGVVPLDQARLESLPGIGQYIRSAVRVFSGGFEDELIDTNTVRIICRVYGMPMTDSTRRSNNIRALYSRLRNNADPRAFGYAMIDLASSVCRPRMPMCESCPLIRSCKTGASRLSHFH